LAFHNLKRNGLVFGVFRKEGFPCLEFVKIEFFETNFSLRLGENLGLGLDLGDQNRTRLVQAFLLISLAKVHLTVRVWALEFELGVISPKVGMVMRVRALTPTTPMFVHSMHHIATHALRLKTINTPKKGVLIVFRLSTCAIEMAHYLSGV